MKLLFQKEYFLRGGPPLGARGTPRHHMKAYEAFCEKSIFDKNRDFGDFCDFMMIQEIGRKMAGYDQNALICAKTCSLDHKTYSTYISCHIMIINRKKF